MIALVLPFWFSGYDADTDYYAEAPSVEISYKDGEKSFTLDQKGQIRKIIVESEAQIRKLLPTLPEGIKVEGRNQYPAFSFDTNITCLSLWC